MVSSDISISLYRLYGAVVLQYSMLRVASSGTPLIPSHSVMSTESTIMKHNVLLCLSEYQVSHTAGPYITGAAAFCTHGTDSQPLQLIALPRSHRYYCPTHLRLYATGGSLIKRILKR